MNKLDSINQRNFANQLQLSFKTVLPAMTNSEMDIQRKLKIQVIKDICM